MRRAGSWKFHVKVFIAYSDHSVRGSQRRVYIVLFVHCVECLSQKTLV